jgi:hypothetical protein
MEDDLIPFFLETGRRPQNNNATHKNVGFFPSASHLIRHEIFKENNLKNLRLIFDANFLEQYFT